jgi:hypothetical protein
MTLVEHHGVLGGIYIQEPDASPASIDALTRLVASNPDFFPLGFAYGHLSGVGAGLADLSGRGFASQQLVEELGARKNLSDKVVKLLEQGGQRGGGVNVATTIVWVDRLVRGNDWVSRVEQRATLSLLAEVWPPRELPFVVRQVGGVQVLIRGFFLHYELTTPTTLLEAGFNFNYTKALLRLLRNKGVLRDLDTMEKRELAAYLCSPALYGWGLTYVLQRLRLRVGLHKFAKEGLACLVESCTADDLPAVLEAVGGRAALNRHLRGWLSISRSYWRRFLTVEQALSEDGSKPTYTYPELRYGSLDPSEHSYLRGSRKYIHSKDKGQAERCGKAARKSACCTFTTVYVTFLNTITGCTFVPCCVLPRLFSGILKSAYNVPVLLSIIVGIVLGIGCFLGSIYLMIVLGLFEDEEQILEQRG